MRRYGRMELHTGEELRKGRAAAIKMEVCKKEHIYQKELSAKKEWFAGKYEQIGLR